MLDALVTFWAWVAALFADPRVAAAVPAFIISWFIGNKSTALVCAIISFFSIRLILWMFSIPVEGAAGIGVFIALMGVHGIQDRLSQLDVAHLVNVIVQAIKGRK